MDITLQSHLFDAFLPLHENVEKLRVICLHDSLIHSVTLTVDITKGCAITLCQYSFDYWKECY